MLSLFICEDRDWGENKTDDLNKYSLKCRGLLPLLLAHFPSRLRQFTLYKYGDLLLFKMMKKQIEKVVQNVFTQVIC